MVGMQITVFGASGRVGRLVVAGAVSRGYNVVAFVHSHNPFEGTEGVRVVQGDISDKEAVAAALQGSQAVISTLGSWGTKQKSILEQGMQAILPAMREATITRIITVTGSGAHWSADKPKLSASVGRLLIKLVASKILRDGERHLQLLEASYLDWTSVRSPVMKGSGNTYALNQKAPSLLASVPREAVATCLVDLLDNGRYSQQAPYIHRH